MVESMITMAISVFLIAGLLYVFVLCNRFWHVTGLDLSTTRKGNQCLEKMVYGVGTGMGLRAAYWVTNWGTSTNWLLQSSNYYEQVWYKYEPASGRVIFSNASFSCVIGTNVVASQVSTSAFGLSISLTLQQSDGPFPDGNSLNTFVKLRTPRTQ